MLLIASAYARDTCDADWLTVPEVAHELRLSLPTIYRRVASGDLEAYRLGEHGPLRIRRDALEEFVQPAGPKAAA